MKATLTEPSEPDEMGCNPGEKLFTNISSSVLYGLGLVFHYLALVLSVISQGYSCTDLYTTPQVSESKQSSSTINC